MRLGRRDPVHRAAVLKRERELLARLFNSMNVPTETFSPSLFHHPHHT